MGIPTGRDLDFDAVLEHYGVKGMKWGVRRTPEQLGRARTGANSKKTPPEIKTLGPDSLTRKTPSGETITLKKEQLGSVQKFIANRSSKYREELSNSASLTIHDGSGKKIGDAQVSKRSSEELNLVWLGINKSARGKGYATQVMQAARQFGEQQGFKKLTLEVPGNSPDAHHIYTKLGFKVTKEPDGTNDVWGGLTEMEYVFDKAKHSDDLGGGMSNEFNLETEYGDFLDLLEEHISSENLDFDNVLEHYGVKGMKWGVRRTPEQLGRARAARKARKAAAKKQKEADRSRPASADATRAAEARRIAKNAGTSKLSNQELEFLVNRMNLENRYTKVLGDDQKSAGKIFLDRLITAENKAFKEGKASPTVGAIDNTTKFVGKALEKTMGVIDIGPDLDRALKRP